MFCWLSLVVVVWKSYCEWNFEKVLLEAHQTSQPFSPLFSDWNKQVPRNQRQRRTIGRKDPCMRNVSVDIYTSEELHGHSLNYHLVSADVMCIMTVTDLPSSKNRLEVFFITSSPPTKLVVVVSLDGKVIEIEEEEKPNHHIHRSYQSKCVQQQKHQIIVATTKLITITTMTIVRRYRCC